MNLSPSQIRMLRTLDTRTINSVVVRWRTADVLVRHELAKWGRNSDPTLKNWLELHITDEGRAHLRAIDQKLQRLGSGHG